MEELRKANAEAAKHRRAREDAAKVEARRKASEDRHKAKEEAARMEELRKVKEATAKVGERCKASEERHKAREAVRVEELCIVREKEEHRLWALLQQQCKPQ